MTGKHSKEKWWQKLMPLSVAVIAFIGSALGAGVPWWVFSAQEAEKRLLDSRLGAYNDFFKGQAKLQEATTLRAQGSNEEAKKAEEEYSSLVKSAKFRIAVYGTRTEIAAIVAYFKEYLSAPPCGGPRPERWRDDARIYQEIRKGIFRNDSSQLVDEESLILLLFDCQVPDSTHN